MKTPVQIQRIMKNPRLATIQVESCLGAYNKSELAEMLKISRGTLNNRLKKNNWRMKEIEAINTKLPKI